MRNYVLHRLVLFLPTGIGVSLFIFGMLHVIPGDYAIALLMGRDRTGISTEEDFERVREKLGLNGSLPEQYLRWAGDFFTGDFGTSWSSNKLVIDRLAPRVVLSAELSVMAVVLACL